MAFVADSTADPPQVNMPELELYWNIPTNYPEKAADRAKWFVEVHRYIDSDGDDDFEWVELAATESLANSSAQYIVANVDTASLITGASRREQYRVRYVIDPDRDDQGVAPDDAPTANDIPGREIIVRLPLPLDAGDRNNHLPLIIVAVDNDAEAAADLRFARNTDNPKTSIDLLWQRNANLDADDDEKIPTGYVIDYSEDGGATWHPARNATRPTNFASTTEYEHEDRMPGKRYTYRVFPWHKDVFGEPAGLTPVPKRRICPTR